MATKKTETKQERVELVHEKSGTHVTVGSDSVDAYTARGYAKEGAKKAAPAKAPAPSAPPAPPAK